jgi:hypothetical protein
MKRMAMTMIGGSHHHQPLMIAALSFTQEMVMPGVGASNGPRPIRCGVPGFRHQPGGRPGNVRWVSIFPTQ